MNDFKFCPNCGSNKISNINMRKWYCPDCNFELYNNIASAVGVIIQDKFHNVLFEIRAKNPKKGYVALPGGFVDRDETAEEAVIRECKEEIGFTVEKPHYICTNPNTYLYKNIEYKTCDIFYKVPLPEQFSSIEDFIKVLKPQESEVVKFVTYRVENESDVDKIPLAFESSKFTLKRLLGGI